MSVKRKTSEVWSEFLTSQESGFSSAYKAETAAEKLLLAAEEAGVKQSAAAASTTLSVVDADNDWNACKNFPSSSSTDEQSNGIERGSRNYSVETEKYLTEKNLGCTDARTDSTFSYWAGNKERYSRLAALARKFLSAPMVSIASEREFKAGNKQSRNS